MFALLPQLRAPGGIGASAFPSRVWPNRVLPGHMGNARVTIQNLVVAAVYPEDNLIAIRGSVPGFDGRFVVIRPAKKRTKQG